MIVKRKDYHSDTESQRPCPINYSSEPLCSPFVLFLCGLSLAFLAGCELDGFLFNEEEVDGYLLPGNVIPDSLLEEVTFPSEGNRLYGYWIESNGARPGLIILYCHGNKHNLDEYWDRVMLMHRTGVNILIFDYRGFGMSEGEPSENGLHSDAKAAWSFVQSRGFGADSTILFGYSLGNVPAIYLAVHEVAGWRLICEAPFASAKSLTQGSLALDLPARWLTEGKFDNAEEIKRVNSPLLLMHGRDDDFVRWEDNGKVVYENAPEPKRLALVAGGKHDDLPKIMGEDEYVRLIEEWIR